MLALAGGDLEQALTLDRDGRWVQFVGLWSARRRAITVACKRCCSVAEDARHAAISQCFYIKCMARAVEAASAALNSEAAFMDYHGCRYTICKRSRRIGPC